MIKFGSTARKLANQYKARIRAIDAGLRRLVRNAAIGINNAAEDNLSGSNADAPGSYPVPNRTGNLLRSQNWKMGGKHSAFVFNTASYADDIHSGRDSSAKYGARPFLDDAVTNTPYLDEMQKGYRKLVLN